MKIPEKVDGKRKSPSASVPQSATSTDALTYRSKGGTASVMSIVPNFMIVVLAVYSLAESVSGHSIQRPILLYSSEPHNSFYLECLNLAVEGLMTGRYSGVAE